MAQTEWQRRNRERLREYSKQWRAANKDKRKAQKQRYYAKHREEVRQRAKEKYHTDPARKQRVSEYGKRYRSEHSEWSAEYTRRYRAENRDLFIASRRAHRDRFRDKVYSYIHKRRALKRGSGGTYRIADWRTMCALADHRCLRCGADAVSVDHVLAIALGGENSIFNIQPLCRNCNAKKGTAFIDYRTDSILSWLGSLAEHPSESGSPNLPARPREECPYTSP